MTIALFLALLVALGFAVARFVVPVHGLNKGDVYKDLAHVFVGGLFGAGCFDHAYLWLALGLTAAEVVAFFTRKPRDPS